MRKLIIATAAAAALLFGGLLTPNNADARPWVYRAGPFYAGAYRPYYRPYYGPYSYSYGYYQPYSYGYRYNYGYPAYRTGANVWVGPGVGVYVR